MSHRASIAGVFLLAFSLSWLFGQSATTGTQYAVLISVSKYSLQDQWRTLDTAIEETEEFRQALTKTGFEPENIVFLHDRQTTEKLRPTAVNILSKLHLILDEMKEGDTLLVALNGHGVQFYGDKTGYFAPLNADWRDKKTLVPLEGKEGLYGLLEKSKASRRLLIVNGIVSCLTIASYGLLSVATPFVVISFLLLAGGFLRSLQFTAMNALSYADIDRPDASKATTFYTVAQQLSLSAGVAVAAFVIEAAQAARGETTITVNDFSIAFLVVGGLAMFSVLQFRQLETGAGASVLVRGPEPAEGRAEV